jgi:glutathione S-transferase
MTTNIQLYAMAFQDRSDRVRWLLEEMNVPYTNHFLDRARGDMNETSYRKINSMGRVPTIVDGEVILFESSAICMYLADKYSLGKLAPRHEDVEERAEYTKWMIWSVGSLECVIARMFTHVSNENEKAQTHAYVKDQCKILSLPLTEILSKQDYILKSGFSAADIMLAAILPGAFDYIIKGNVYLENYMNRLTERASAKKAKVFE